MSRQGPSGTPQVLVQLIDGPDYPVEIADSFGTTRANLSNHLTCLHECGPVSATAEGRRVRHELADQRLAEGLRILAALDLPGCCLLVELVGLVGRQGLEP